MTGRLEVKITISEFVTPALFQAMAAVSNPRQRAALLKRLAEDALRGIGVPNSVPQGLNRSNDNERDASLGITDSAEVAVVSLPVKPRRETDGAVTRATVSNDENRQFDYAFLADKLGDF
jgi:hypothetical protein